MVPKSYWHMVARVTMAEYLGRAILTSEDVHHIDGDVTNNNIDNLQLMDEKEHGRMHMTGNSYAKGHQYKPTPASNKKRSLAMTGFRHSEESIKKMRSSWEKRKRLYGPSGGSRLKEV